MANYTKILRKLRIKLNEEQGGICPYCNEIMTFEEQSLDHVIPKSLYGHTRHKRVMVVAHKFCNIIKGDNIVYSDLKTKKIEMIGKSWHQH